MDWISNHWWEAWLAIALVLAVAELVSLDLILIMMAAGAATAMIPAALGANVVVQVFVAAVVSLGMLAVARPKLMREFHQGANLKVGHERLIGRSGKVTHAITASTPGRVLVDGEVWTAAPYDEQSSIPEGAAVEVLLIRGATAYVHPVAQLGD